MKYRKRFDFVEAFQFVAHDTGLEPDWFIDAINAGWISRNRTEKIEGSDWLLVQTPKDDVPAYRRDWIIRGIKGEIYPCKPDIFERSYEAVDETKT